MEVHRGLDHASTLSPRLRAFLTVCLFGVLVFLIYSNSLDCSWQFDDITNITNNKYLQIEDLSLHSLRRTLVADPGRPGAIYRPVACLTFGLNHYFGELQVRGYHLVNIVIHLLSSIFLFLFILHTLNSFSSDSEYASRSYFIALMAALMWAIHPIQIQSVTYIVQRMTSFAGLFYVLSLYLYAKGRTNRIKGVKVVCFSLCAVSFALGFGAKENAVLLPVSLVLYEILVIQKGNSAFIRRRMKGILLILAGVVFLSVLYLHYWRGGVFSFLEGYEDRPFSLSERLLTEPRIILFYVSLLIYPMPHRFSVAHSMEISRSLIDPPSTLLSILAITGSVVFLILRARKNPLISFSFLFFLLNHLVESSAIPLELIFEHRNYVPSMMFFLPFALWFNALLNSRIRQWAIRPLASGLILFILIFLGCSTYLRNIVWKNPGTLWTDALQKAPDQLRVHHNLGLYYHETGLKQEALSHYLQALRSSVIQRKDEPVGVFYQLGQLYVEVGEYEKAKSAYKQAISMKPDLSSALVNLASIYDQEGDRTTANEYLIKALKAGPNDPTVNLNVGLYYLRARNPEAAIHHLAKALKEKKLESKSLMYLGIASEQRELYEVSEHQFKDSLALNPKNITPHLHLAEVYIRTGRETEARMEVERIITLLIRDRNLFGEVMDLIVTEGDRGDVLLSGDLLLPFLARALEDTPNGQMREEIKKIMEKRTKIR